MNALVVKTIELLSHQSRFAASSFVPELATDVPEVGPSRVEVHTSILWQPDLPTGGFPVLPVTSAA